MRTRHSCVLLCDRLQSISDETNDFSQLLVIVTSIEQRQFVSNVVIVSAYRHHFRLSSSFLHVVMVTVCRHRFCMSSSFLHVVMVSVYSACRHPSADRHACRMSSSFLPTYPSSSIECKPPLICTRSPRSSNEDTFGWKSPETTFIMERNPSICRSTPMSVRTIMPLPLLHSATFSFILLS